MRQRQQLEDVRGALLTMEGTIGHAGKVQALLSRASVLLSVASECDRGCAFHPTHASDSPLFASMLGSSFKTSRSG